MGRTEWLLSSCRDTNGTVPHPRDTRLERHHGRREGCCTQRLAHSGWSAFELPRMFSTSLCASLFTPLRPDSVARAPWRANCSCLTGQTFYGSMLDFGCFPHLWRVAGVDVVVELRFGSPRAVIILIVCIAGRNSSAVHYLGSAFSSQQAQARRSSLENCRR